MNVSFFSDHFPGWAATSRPAAALPMIFGLAVFLISLALTFTAFEVADADSSPSPLAVTVTDSLLPLAEPGTL